MSNSMRQRIPVSDVQMFRSLRVESVEFSSQMRSGAVLMENRHGKGQTDKRAVSEKKGLDGQPMKSSEKGET